MGNTLSGPPKPAPERRLPRQGRRNPVPQQTKINLSRKLGLVKIDYAGQGTCDGLLANLAALIDDTTARLRFGQMIADACL
jgi:hypothetical protein